ncbi:MAG: tRNA (adenosine(37)-N6)-threonylcarbamoyltransferase complex ATPase subunit type 1 TsaE [Bacteroidia bacterium]
MQYNAAQIKEAAKSIIPYFNQFKLICFYGEMGAGKTTLIKSICAELNMMDEVSSPSFGLVNEYKNSAEESFFHFDFYRIKSIEEVYDMGYEDYFDSGHVCFIEWPEKINDILSQENYLKISIQIQDTYRILSIEEVQNY